MREYSEQELNQLHDTLFEILEEIIRVCDILKIEYFAIGGSAIGVYFWKDIIPWDDDMDIGMARDNYNRFLKEAPAVLKPEFFLAWYGSDPETPFYFAKLRKRNTLFMEEACRKLNMNQGIYVDVFPFDKVPKSKKAERLQRKLANRLNECFAGKSVWTWRYFGKCEIQSPNPKGFFGCLFTRAVVSLFPKRIIYKMLCRVMTMYDNSESDYYNHIITSFDHVPIVDLRNAKKMKLGPVDVVVPDHLLEYLHHHYGQDVKKIPAKELQVNHAPMKLSFNTRKDIHVD